MDSQQREYSLIHHLSPSLTYTHKHTRARAHCLPVFRRSDYWYTLWPYATLCSLVAFQAFLLRVGEESSNLDKTGLSLTAFYKRISISYRTSVKLLAATACYSALAAVSLSQTTLINAIYLLLLHLALLIHQCKAHSFRLIRKIWFFFLRSKFPKMRVGDMHCCGGLCAGGP